MPQQYRDSLSLSLYLLMKPIFGVVTLAIKFDCLFLGIFQSFR